MNKINVVIADDHSLIREGLKGLLGLEKDIEIIGEAGDGEVCLELIDELKPDVLLLDLNMPKISGLDVLEKLRGNAKAPKILVLTVHDELSFLRRTIGLGAAGYLLKDSDFNTISHAIRVVYNGGTFIDTKMSGFSLDDDENVFDESDLTRREMEILTLIVQGFSNGEIGDKLCISEKTVKNHVSNLFRKMNVADRTQAAVYAIKNNIVGV